MPLVLKTIPVSSLGKFKAIYFIWFHHALMDDKLNSLGTKVKDDQKQKSLFMQINRTVERYKVMFKIFDALFLFRVIQPLFVRIC